MFFNLGLCQSGIFVRDLQQMNPSTTHQETYNGPSKMAHQLKAFPAKPGDLSLIPRTT